MVRSLKSQSGKMVTKFSKLQDYLLSKSDIIKIGRVKYKVKDFRTQAIESKTEEEVIYLH